MVLEHRNMSSDSLRSIRFHEIDLKAALSAFALSVISVKGISLSLPVRSRPSFQRIMPQSFLWVILFFLLWIGHSVLWTVSGREARKTAFKLSVFYTLCSISGYFLKTWGTFLHPWNGLNETVNFICYAIGYFYTVFGFLLLLIRMLPIVPFSPGGRLFRGSPGKLFILAMSLLLILWMPWFLQLNPGITTPDSDNQIMQILGYLPVSNNHPYFHTLWIRLMFFLGGNPQNGVMLYSILQLLLSAAAFSFCICFIDSVFQQKAASAAVFLWFAFYPVYPIYGMTVWKDIPFALCLLIIVINICCILRTDDEEVQKQLLIRNAVLFLILCFLRHNGILVFIPAAIVILCHQKNHRKLYLVLCLCAVSIYLLFQYAAVPLLNIKAGRGSEGFSIPLQQIARVTAKYGNELTDEQKQVLSRYFREDPAELYAPTLSDKVKENFNETLFAQDPKPLLRLWWELGKAYPWDYIESILHNSYGFWYPEEEHPTFFFGQNSEGYLGITDAPLISSGLMRKLQDYLQNMKYYSVPVLSRLFSPAAGAWVLIFTWIYSRYRKNRFRLAQVPLLSLWIQMFGSPAYCDFRYVYGLFTCLPLIICCTILIPPDENTGLCQEDHG